MSQKTFELIKSDCVDWMTTNKEKVDCIITSPPYNINVKYGEYDDSMPRNEYLKWMGDVANAMKETLRPDGQIFLNVGYTNIDPFISMDVAQVFRKYFILQNQFIWVKHIAVQDTGYGQYKPITSKRFISITTENIFHFTKKGDVEIDRLSIGQRNKTHPIWPELYSEGRHLANCRRSVARKMKFKNYLDIKENATKEEKDYFFKEVEKKLKLKPYEPDKKKCIGNAWYIPYTPTSKLSRLIGIKGDVNSRENSRANHPATFPPALPEKCIKLSGIKKGSIVYDPFVGTGTTVVEAIKLGMIGIGTDVSDEFIKFAKKRVANDESLNPTKNLKSKLNSKKIKIQKKQMSFEIFNL